jgi:hypothetical protein
MEPAMSKLAYPQMRANIFDAIEALADTALQWRAWVGGDVRPVGECPNFENAIHWLFDDSGFDGGTDASVGFTLYDSDEARAIDEVMNNVDRLLKKYGTHLSDNDYVGTPEWPAIVSAASRCAKLFRDNDRRNA